MSEATAEGPIRAWLNEIWARTERVAVLQGGEDVSLALRPNLATIEDHSLLRQVERLTTSGDFAGDLCRCPGDLTIVLFDGRNSEVGSATVHPERISWDRTRFQNDLISSDQIALRLLFSKIGINGTSTAILSQLISALNLHERDVQFRPAGDLVALTESRVPTLLAGDLLQLSGEEAGSLDQESVTRLASELIRVDSDLGLAVRQIMAWLGSATWPAEAIGGDGQLARRLLNEFDPAYVVSLLPEISDPFEVMGAVVWAAFRDDDVAMMNGVASAVVRLLAKP